VTIRIVHLSDIHFGGEMADAAEAAIAAAAAFEPTLTVVTGDLTLNGLPREFRAARAWLARLAGPVIVTPGNHDTPYWNLLLRALVPFDRYRRFIGEPDFAAFDAPGLAARCINSARGGQPRLDWSKGALSIERLKRLRWGERSERPLRLFACHHPLIDLAGAPVTGGVRRGAEAMAVLAAEGVELVLTGHVHNPSVLPLPYAEHGCYAVGAGTLSQRLRGTPASFTTILADETSFEVTAQGWTGAAFEPIQLWSLPRRP
jgi:3',5'-cyclic AMP phosphodiesterase CpdA